MKLFEAFAGYGGASFALKKLGVPFELVGYSEIDKYAIKCFEQNHGSKNYGDMKLIDWSSVPDFDLLTGGFPCQSFSVAGHMKGELDPRGTLFYEIIRCAEIKKPKFMLLENVKGLTCKKFKDTFDKILSELDRVGYNVAWKVLNSKDFGIPQSRARVWFVCIRKDIYEPFKFKFPEPVELKIFIKDILENEVDSKYYLSEKLQERFRHYIEEKNNKIGNEPDILDLYNKKVKTDGTSITLTEPHYNNLRLIEAEKETKIVAMRQRDRHGKNELREQNLEPREDNCSNTISIVQKDNLVYDRKGFDSRTKGFRESELCPTLSTKMGTGGNNVPMISNCLDANYYKGINTNQGHQSSERGVITNGQLRRLTPKECFRLMGFLNDEINLDGLSDTQKYKLAGNGWEINLASLILKNLITEYAGEKL